MEQKLKNSIQAEVSLQGSNLGNYNATDPEYAKTMNAVIKLNALLVEDEKSLKEVEMQEKRLDLEKQKLKESKSVEKAKQDLEEQKFEHEKEQDALKYQLEQTKLSVELKNIELNQKKLESDIKIAELQAKREEKAERNRLILTLIGTFSGIVIESAALVTQICIANKSLALEYCDNGITPKKTSEAYRNLNSFIRNKGHN